jgi:phosphoribosylglycinamide formyltransferase-1
VPSLCWGWRNTIPAREIEEFIVIQNKWRIALVKRLGILGSTRGTVMLDLFDAIKQKHLEANISIVLSNKSDALILERAKTQGVPALFVDPMHLTREAYDQQLSQKLQEAQVDLIVLIGFMRILSGEFLKTWHEKVINVHPSLLPAFAGKMDQSVHQAVLDAKVKETGCTVHYVTEEVDAGPILVQEKCMVLPGDTVERLKARVQALESVALISAINKLVS